MCDSPEDTLFRDLEAQVTPKSRVLENEYLSKHTTICIGGPARVFLEAGSVQDVALGLRRSVELSVPWALLGRGSNVLVSDQGFPGLVVVNACNGLSMADPVTVRAEAGVRLSDLCDYAQDAELSGLEFLSGIPGTVGGAVAMDAHFPDPLSLCCDASGRPAPPRPMSVSRCSGSVRTLDLMVPGFPAEWVPIKCYYRGHAGPALPSDVARFVSEVEFQLAPAAKATVKHLRTRARRYRASREVWNPATRKWVPTGGRGEPGGPSLGCIFRNPPGAHSAGWLLENAGAAGLCEGNATISAKHANYIIKADGASAAQVRKLIGQAKDLVRESSGIELHEEIVYL